MLLTFCKKVLKPALAVSVKPAEAALNWIEEYKTDQHFKTLTTKEKLLVGKAYEIFLHWTEGNLPNLLTCSTVPTLQLCDLGYCEERYSTEELKNVNNFLVSFASRCLILDDDLDLLQITQPRKRARCDPTSTLCTIARSTEDNVDAASSPESRLFNMLSTEHKQSTSASGTMNVSSCISVRKGATCVASFLETPPKPYQVQVRCYRTEDIEGLSQLEKFKKAYISLTVHVNSRSSVHSNIERLTADLLKEHESQGARLTTYNKT